MNEVATPIWTTGSTEERKTGTWRSNIPNYQNLPSPCLSACPVDGDIALWIQQVKEKEYQEAWLTLMDNNPFPSIAGRICHHPCETACNRKAHDTEISICKLERHVGDMALSKGWGIPVENEPQRERIAVVGGGPAGLSVAYQLRRRGYGVTIYEASEALGGLMRWGIPRYRLAENILDAEIQRILDFGVEVVTDAEVSSAKELATLREEFDAVYIATGATRSKILPNLDYSKDWVVDSADYLAASSRNRPLECGRDMVVIGGGSAAMDVARSARRYGKDVTVLSLEAEAQLPAQRVEVDEAIAEEIRFVDSSMLQSVVEQKQGLSLNCVKVRFLPGEQRGEFTIEEIAGSEFVLQAEVIVPAIGQDVDLDLWQAMLDRNGPVIAIDDKYRTRTEGIFSGGDMASMDRFVTQAIGMGKHAAVQIEHYLWLKNKPDTPEPRAEELDDVPYEIINTYYHSEIKPAKARSVPIGKRLETFDEVQLGMTLAEAEVEAERCFSCGNCIFCDNCYNYCPDMAIVKLDRGYAVKADYCKGCGLCVAECPTGSIHMEADLDGIRASAAQ
jgi:NADPH-dependent glutamate synthase beta subunit-like oxidoreductase